MYIETILAFKASSVGLPHTNNVSCQGVQTGHEPLTSLDPQRLICPVQVRSDGQDVSRVESAGGPHGEPYNTVAVGFDERKLLAQAVIISYQRSGMKNGKIRVHTRSRRKPCFLLQFRCNPEHQSHDVKGSRITCLRRACRFPFCWSQLTRVVSTSTLFCQEMISGWYQKK